MADSNDIELINPDVVTKYRKAGEIAQAALEGVLALVKPGAHIVSLCDVGDSLITQATSKIYNKKKVEKGICFPTCISLNHIAGHFSPLSTDESVIAEGDLVKVDLGCHIDGYAAVVAHSFVVGFGAPGQELLTGRKADVLMAANHASQAAFKLLKAGNTNDQITEVIQQLARSYGVNPVQGVVSHILSRFVLDGEKIILGRIEPEHKVPQAVFRANEVYALDIVMSTAEGKPNQSESRTTVFRRANQEVYNLKLKASRSVFADINKRFPTFPFSLRYFDETKAKLAVKECMQHNLLQPYPVLQEREGEFVAHIKLTAIILPSGTIKLCGGNWNTSGYKSELSINDENVRRILGSSSGNTKQKKKNTVKDEDGDE